MDDKDQILFRPATAAMQRAVATLLLCFSLAVGGTSLLLPWFMPDQSTPTIDAEQKVLRETIEAQTENVKELFLKTASPEERTEFERTLQAHKLQREISSAESQKRIATWKRTKTIIRYILFVPAALLIAAAVLIGIRDGVVAVLRHGTDRIRLTVDNNDQLIVSRPGFGSWIKPVHQCRTLTTLQPIAWRLSKTSGTGNLEGPQTSWTWIVTLKSEASKVSDRLEFTIVTQYFAPVTDSRPPSNVASFVAALSRLTKQVQNG